MRCRYLASRFAPREGWYRFVGRDISYALAACDGEWCG